MVYCVVLGMRGGIHHTCIHTHASSFSRIDVGYGRLTGDHLHIRTSMFSGYIYV